jgi:hypothetical protein
MDAEVRTWDYDPTWHEGTTYHVKEDAAIVGDHRGHGGLTCLWARISLVLMPGDRRHPPLFCFECGCGEEFALTPDELETELSTTNPQAEVLDNGQ